MLDEWKPFCLCMGMCMVVFTCAVRHSKGSFTSSENECESEKGKKNDKHQRKFSLSLLFHVNAP